MEDNKIEHEVTLSNKEINKDLSKINTELRKVRKIFANVIELYNIFTKKEENIKNVIEKSKQANLSLSDVKTKIDESLKEVDGIINDIKDKNAEIEKFATEIAEYKTQIDDDENGVRKIFSDIDELNLEINANKKEIERSISNFKNIISEHSTDIGNAKEEVLKKKIQIENYEKEIDDNVSQINGYKNEAISMIEEISKIYELARDTGLANSFDSRRKRVSKSSTLWLGLLIFFIVSLLVWVYFLFSHEGINNVFQMNKVDDPYFKFIFKLTLSSPLIFAIWFSSIQYAKERYILEQYEYKTATALALEQYSKLLENKFDDDFNVEKFEFITNLINKVYKETDYPKHGTSFEGKFKIPFLKKDVEVSSKGEEIKG